MCPCPAAPLHAPRPDSNQFGQSSARSGVCQHSSCLCLLGAHPACSGVTQPSTVTFHLAELSNSPPDSTSNVTVYQTLVQVMEGLPGARCKAAHRQARAPCREPAAPHNPSLAPCLSRIRTGQPASSHTPAPPRIVSRWFPTPATSRRCSPPGAAGAALAAQAAQPCQRGLAGAAACWTARRAAGRGRCCRPAPSAPGATAQPHAHTRWVPCPPFHRGAIRHPFHLCTASRKSSLQRTLLLLRADSRAGRAPPCRA